jgi:putative hydrolase of the HAD superfamily
MVKAVIFDLDNTLVNFWEFKTLSSANASKAMIEAGLEMSEESAKKLIFKIYETYGFEYQLTFTQMLKPLKLEKKKFERIRNCAISAYLRTKEQMLRPYVGVEDMLENLSKDYKLAILTDAPREQAHQRLEFCKLKNYFSAIGTFHDTNIYKPGVEPFRKILTQLEVEPKQAIMIGDNPSRDIRGATLAGMRTCFAKYGHNFGDDGTKAEFEVKNPTDIIDIVRKI